MGRGHKFFMFLKNNQMLIARKGNKEKHLKTILIHNQLPFPKSHFLFRQKSILPLL